jgi:hypothetical protein
VPVRERSQMTFWEFPFGVEVEAPDSAIPGVRRIGHTCRRTELEHGICAHGIAFSLPTQTEWGKIHQGLQDS